VAKGVHRVMGSDEYKREAENVNRRLLEALRTLEDSIKRRDRDIADLQNQVTELTAKLNGEGNG
jgi:chaperonin cofactor prefoldin